MGCFADVVAVGSGAVDGPAQAGGRGFFLQDAFCQWAAADIAEADHEKGGRFFIHGRKGKECGLLLLCEGDGEVAKVVTGEADGSCPDLWNRAVSGILFMTQVVVFTVIYLNCPTKAMNKMDKDGK